MLSYNKTQTMKKTAFKTNNMAQKQKTALQQAIRDFKANAYLVGVTGKMTNDILNHFEQYLPTEQQQIEDAWHKGWQRCYGKKPVPNSASDYFTQTYKQ
jgi:hypothetical protein